MNLIYYTYIHHIIIKKQIIYGKNLYNNQNIKMNCILQI
jgi:hypothetical protein